MDVLLIRDGVVENCICAAQDPVIEDGLMLLTLAEEVDPADRDTIYFVQHCVTLGLITQFDADLILRTE